MDNQQQSQMPPSVISTKDHLYLNDMLNWNLLAMKKSAFHGAAVPGSNVKARTRPRRTHAS